MTGQVQRIWARMSTPRALWPTALGGHLPRARPGYLRGLDGKVCDTMEIVSSRTFDSCTPAPLADGMSLQSASLPQAAANPQAPNQVLHQVAQQPAVQTEAAAPVSIRLPFAGEEIWHGERVYRLGQCIGTGYYGQVYACMDRWLNDLVAKVLVPRNQTYEDVRNQWQWELDNLRTLRHPKVTYVHDAFEYERTFYLIVERCSQDLPSLFQAPGYDGSVWLPSIARDVLQAVEFIHNAGYIHKDLHPGNILIAATRDRVDRSKMPVYSFKVGDLGISRLERDIDVFNTILAQWMLPPEALDPGTFGTVGKSVDIYHVGLVFLSVMLGYVPTFSHEEIVAGAPRHMAEQLQSPYGAAIAKALRRHVHQRPQTAASLWDEVLSAMPQGAVPF